MSNKTPRKPRVYIDEKPYFLMSLWARLAGNKSYEMTCFGRTTIDEGEPYVTDAYLVKHKGTAGSVEADDEDVVKLMMKLNSEGVPPDEAFRCWVHSHPGTGPSATYLSSTDEANIDRIMTSDWLVSIVFDSKGENPYCRIDVQTPMRMRIEADLVVLEPPVLTDEELKAAKDLFEEKSSRATPTYTAPSHKGGTSYPYRSNTPYHPRQTGFGGYGGGYDGWYGGGQATKPGTSSGSSAGGYRGATGGLPSASGTSGSSSSSTTGSTGSGSSSSSTAKTVSPKLSGEDAALLREHLKKAFDLDDEDIQDQWIQYATEHMDELEQWKEAFSMDESKLDDRDVPDATSVLAEGDADDDLDFIIDRFVGEVPDLPFEVVEDNEENELLFELVEEDADTVGGSDAVPAYDPASKMLLAARSEDLDRIAEHILAKTISEEQAIDLVKERHNLSESEAQVELATRIG